MHIQTERNFPQAKLDSEINARFLLNGHGNLYFFTHNNSVHIILLNLEKKLEHFIGGKKDIDERLHKTITL